MHCLWLEDQKASIRDVPRPVAASGEAVLRLLLAGVCQTDLELRKGYYPYSGILGHEFVAIVVEAPDSPEWIGRRVVGDINASCGTCSVCRAGRSHHCPCRSVLGIVNRNGVFAEFFTLPVRNLLVVPDGVEDNAAVFVEPLAAALEILDQTHIRPDDRVLVVGAGRLGQLIARIVRLTGCDLSVVARHPHQRSLLMSQGIAVIDGESVPERAVDVVIDASGTPAGFQLARQAVRPRGVLVLKSTYRGNLDVDISAIVVDEITVIGSRCGPFAPALRLLAAGKIDPTPLIEFALPLSEGIRALELSDRPGALKILLHAEPGAPP